MNDLYQHAKEKEQQSWAILPLGQGKGPHSVSAAVVLVRDRCEQEHGCGRTLPARGAAPPAVFVPAYAHHNFFTDWNKLTSTYAYALMHCLYIQQR
jgi:hypothetical protein